MSEVPCVPYQVHGVAAVRSRWRQRSALPGQSHSGASLPTAGAPAGRAWVSIRPLPYESRIGLLEFGRPWIGCRQARAVNHGKNWCRLVSAPASCRARYVASTTIAHQDRRPLDNHASRFVKIAIAHDWLVTLGGSELVLRELLRIFPGATVFTLIDKMPQPDRAFVGVSG